MVLSSNPVPGNGIHIVWFSGLTRRGISRTSKLRINQLIRIISPGIDNRMTVYLCGLNKERVSFEISNKTDTWGKLNDTTAEMLED